MSATATTESKQTVGVAGADWLISQRYADAQTISELGILVAALLDQWYGGIYHADWNYLKRADWTGVFWIDVRHRGSLSTFDYNDLTRLVFLAHDFGLRLQIEAVGGRPKLLCLTFADRRNSEGFGRHPTLEGAVKKYRETARG